MERHGGCRAVVGGRLHVLFTAHRAQRPCGDDSGSGSRGLALLRCVAFAAAAQTQSTLSSALTSSRIIPSQLQHAHTSTASSPAMCREQLEAPLCCSAGTSRQQWSETTYALSGGDGGREEERPRVVREDETGSDDRWRCSPPFHLVHARVHGDGSSRRHQASPTLLDTSITPRSHGIQGHNKGGERGGEEEEEEEERLESFTWPWPPCLPRPCPLRVCLRVPALPS